MRFDFSKKKASINKNLRSTLEENIILEYENHHHYDLIFSPTLFTLLATSMFLFLENIFYKQLLEAINAEIQRFTKKYTPMNHLFFIMYSQYLSSMFVRRKLKENHNHCKSTKNLCLH